jgi:hypothetical protein
MKNILIILLFAIVNFNTFSAKAESLDSGYEGPIQWGAFRKYMDDRREDDQIKGLSYIISGTLATVGGVIGYHNSEDSFSRGVYVVAQSVGVAAIGYGANTYWNGNEYNSFYYALEGAHLSSAQKGELLQRFLEKEKEECRKSRWIKIATHSLIAVVNLYSASHEEDKNVRSVLGFLAGANAIIAFSYAF